MKNKLFLLTILFSLQLSAQQLPKVLEKSNAVIHLINQDSDFSLSMFKKKEVLDLDLNRVSSEFPYTWKEYYPIHSILEQRLFYSPNRKLFIDVYSGYCYVDEDNSVACDAGPTPILLGNKAKKKLTSVYLKSSSEQIIDVIWTSNEEFYLIKKWELDPISYEIIQYNLKTKTATTYNL